MAQSPTEQELVRAARRWRRDREAARASRAELGALVVAAVGAGMSISAAARVTGLERVEVRRMMAAPAPGAGHVATSREIAPRDRG